jgi:hypothetical protein
LTTPHSLSANVGINFAEQAAVVPSGIVRSRIQATGFVCCLLLILQTFSGMGDAIFEPTPRRGPCPRTQHVCPVAVHTIQHMDTLLRLLGECWDITAWRPFYASQTARHVAFPSFRPLIISLHLFASLYTLLPPRVPQGHDITGEDAVQTGRQLTRLLQYLRPGTTDKGPLFREGKTLPQTGSIQSSVQFTCFTYVIVRSHTSAATY